MFDWLTRNHDQSITIVTIAKDEERWIGEWLVYYRHILGVDRVLLYDNNTDTGQLLPHIEPYRDFVEVIPWQGEQVDAYSDALARCSTNYIGFFDIDEFLVLKKWRDIKHLISDLGKDRLIFAWRMFSSMGFAENPNGLVIRNYTQAVSDPDKQKVPNDIKGRGFWELYKTKYIIRRNKLKEPKVHRCHTSWPCRTRDFSLEGWQNAYVAHFAYKSFRDSEDRDIRGYTYEGDRLCKPGGMWDGEKCVFQGDTYRVKCMKHIDKVADTEEDFLSGEIADRVEETLNAYEAGQWGSRISSSNGKTSRASSR